MTEKSIFFEFERCGSDLHKSCNNGYPTGRFRYFIAQRGSPLFDVNGYVPLNSSVLFSFRVFSLKQVIKSLIISLCGVFNRVCFSIKKSFKQCDGCR